MGKKKVSASAPRSSKKAPAKKKTPARERPAKKARARKKAGPRLVRTLAEVAGHFGRSFHTIKKDWRPAWPEECGQAGAWNLDAIAKWRRETLERSQEPASEVMRRKREAEARIKEAEARRKERENRLAEAAVVYREDAEGFIAELLRMVRDTHQRLAEEMAPEFPRKVRRELVDSLEQRCAGILSALHVQAQRLVDLDDA